ncbi:hypothetical protein Rs2_04911 [Raphanus sativus]|nr:hypothetical protein Rs2_04911 [Raphanus sativus]
MISSLWKINDRPSDGMGLTGREIGHGYPTSRGRVVALQVVSVLVSRLSSDLRGVLRPVVERNKDVVFFERGLYSSESSGSINKIPMDDILPATKFEDMSRVNPPESCRICQDEFDSAEKVRSLRNCAHVFHKTCIDRWIHEDKMTCPLCRTLIIPDFYFFRL